jgi:hypothetical protein
MFYEEKIAMAKLVDVGSVGAFLSRSAILGILAIANIFSAILSLSQFAESSAVVPGRRRFTVGRHFRKNGFNNICRCQTDYHRVTASGDC